MQGPIVQRLRRLLDGAFLGKKASGKKLQNGEDHRFDPCWAHPKKMVKKQEIKQSQDDEKLFALLCYLISIIGVVIVLATKKDRSEFSIYHAKQGLVLFIAEIATGIVYAIIAGIFAWIPYVGWSIASIIGGILWLLVVILLIVGIINSLTDKKTPLPLIGQYGDKFNF